MSLAWFSFGLKRRKPWEVVLVPHLRFNGSEVLGITDTAARVVKVTCLQSRRDIYNVTVHELVHVICHEARRSRDSLLSEDASEEDIARLIQRCGYDVLTLFGLKLPPFPKGLSRYRKKMANEWEEA